MFNDQMHFNYQQNIITEAVPFIKAVVAEMNKDSCIVLGMLESLSLAQRDLLQLLIALPFERLRTKTLIDLYKVNYARQQSYAESLLGKDLQLAFLPDEDFDDIALVAPNQPDDIQQAIIPTPAISSPKSFGFFNDTTPLPVEKSMKMTHQQRSDRIAQLEEIDKGKRTIDEKKELRRLKNTVYAKERRLDKSQTLKSLEEELLALKSSSM